MSDKDAKKVCGVVMPISAIDGCAESHWADVLEILTEAIEDAGFDANLVSNADDSGIIHKRIIQNLYDNPVVVCDVSGKNPNVMFELGLRLAFDKPTVIVKDEKTSYAFDTSAIEHLEYPRDLRFSRIVDFKQKLTEKIKATHQRATSDANYTTFLKHFGEFKVAKLDKREVSGQEYILEELRALRSAIRRMEIGQLPKDLGHLKARGARVPIEVFGTELTPSAPVEALGLTEIGLRPLRSAGISTVGELLGKSEIDILKIPDAGRRALSEIRTALALHGLGLLPRTAS
ncbi:MAG: DNA-directed RNA polymerase subunit alpha C-terminal domain-containing protein [Roseateles asaccharophilus]|uniref:DNA-directed RNA polymerase subunit alpha C-terminal domain-containing protein n=1 Tax=Roseateles asaccharophilus TaxID=582607 RepID=UPI00391CFDB7